MARVPNVQKTIEVLSITNQTIKFTDDPKTYTIDKNVMEKVDFKKFYIGKGCLMEVGFENDTVMFLKKLKSAKNNPATQGAVPAAQTPAPAPTPAPTGTTSGNQKELTVVAIAGDKGFVKFKEYNPTGWVRVDETLQKAFPANVTANSLACVTILNDAGEDVVKGIALVQKEEPKQPAPTTTGAASAAKVTSRDEYWEHKASLDDVKESERQRSIEAQASVNTASELVAAVATQGPGLTTEGIIAQVSDIAKANFQLIQTLKKS